MPAPIYLGDEVSAAGYRLAGVDARVPAPGTEVEALAAARREAPLVLVTTSIAAHIGDAELRRAATALAPLVLVVPDLLGETPLPDLAARLRAQLGLEG
jgi:vacuolar-type H+-ATPase subunit F/Vma7